MNEENEITIKVEIADKSYFLRCKRDEEPFFRKASRYLNDKLLRYQSFFQKANLDWKDLLAITSLHIASEKIKEENVRDDSPVFKDLEELNLELEEYIK